MNLELLEDPILVRQGDEVESLRNIKDEVVVAMDMLNSVCVW